MRFAFRLEARDDSGHFREGTTGDEFASKDELRDYLLEKEARYAAYALEPDDLAEHEKIEAASAVVGAPAPPDTRSKLALHRQEKPYKITRLEKLG